jgi:hypothetical protein
MPDIDPDLVPVIETLKKNPERAVVVRGYPYRVASVRVRDHHNGVDIRELYGLWEHLSNAAGWDSRNNHSVFVFELDGRRHAVLFSDYTARFGREEDVFETTG